MSVYLYISVFLIIFLLLTGLPVPFCFMLTTAYLVFVLGYDPSFLIPYSYNQMSSMVLLCIPMFILVGGLMDKSGIGESLIDFVDIFVGKIKGSTGAVAVIACAVFGSISGSCAATLSCIGSIMYPRLKAHKYPDGYASALVACAAPLGLLIPPSSQMILFAWVGQQSVLACFLATLAPGLLLTFLLCVINFIVIRKDPNVLSGYEANSGKRIKLSTRAFSAMPALFMPVIVLGGIYGGFMTPTEASAIAVLYSIPVGFFIYRGLNKSNIIAVVIETAATTGVVMIMMFCIMLLSRIYIMEGVPTMILEQLYRISTNKYAILFLLNIFMIIIGMIMDDVSAMLLCTPILLPVMTQIGIHPIHFAGIIGVNLGMGNLTPPTAPTLYFGARMANVPVSKSLKPAMIFLLFAWLPVLLAVTYIPSMALYLPRLILGGAF
ncbi:MAG: TRAP transporter large permease [Synergistaceae bacterium]|nr:TRAP transporter large permease [Synergistaceae bacterium]